jgi:RNA polymerase sigma-70 factor (ECF subfamily)
MKGLVARLIANSVLRADEARNRFAGWSRWFPGAATVDEARFQHAGEPYPRHWREFPMAWPPLDPRDPEIAAILANAVDSLPDRWRDVVVARDMRRQTAADSSARLGVTAQQERDMLNRARAVLRESLAQFLAKRSEQ